MYVLNDLTFIAHPRTASRACSEALLGVGAVIVRAHHRMNDCTTGTVACVVRNMFDVMVSWWHNAYFKPGTNEPLQRMVQPFGDYLHQAAYDCPGHWFRETIYHYGFSRCNRKLRYENLQEDFDALLLDSGFAPQQLQIIGASKRAEYQEYYTPELRAIVEDRWSIDLEMTEHEF